MIKINLVVVGLMTSSLLILLPGMSSQAQTWTGTELTISDPVLGGNYDYTSLFRQDTEVDQTYLKLMLGDDDYCHFDIGHTDWQTSQWKSRFIFDGFGNLFVHRTIGIGISGSEAQLHLASDTDHEFRMSRGNGMYGFRLFRNATQGRFFFQNTDDNNVWGTRIQIEEGGPSWQNLILNPEGGNVGIGTLDPKGYRLAVAGKTITEEVVVKLQGNWPDYVFDSHYKLPVLSELEQFILVNKHLPEVPTAEDVKQNGLSLGEMNAILLKKVEELTMYVIEQNKRLESQDSRINAQQEMIQSLSEALQEVQHK